MAVSLHRQNEKLCERLEQLTHATPRNARAVDAVVTMNEVNDRHGTGLLLMRVLGGSRGVLSIRARTDYGPQEFGEWSWLISHRGLSRAESRALVERKLGGMRVARLLCVPYLADELLTSITLHDLCAAPLCTWIMDDQNIAARLIPDDLMREALQKSSLRLATHPELCRAYEDKFGLPFYILPAVVPERLVARNAPVPVRESPAAATPVPPRAILIGSFWDQVWFDRLCDTVEGSGLAIDWFGNYRSLSLRFGEKALTRAGICPRGVISEEKLADELRRASLAIVPVSPLDGSDSNPGIARLSLPGRILFVAASSNTPVLIVGSDQTCGARFVKHFGVGEVTPYDRASFLSAVARLALPDTQASMRANAARIAPALADSGVSRWLVESTLSGAPADRRFEDLFADRPAESPESAWRMPVLRVEEGRGR